MAFIHSFWWLLFVLPLVPLIIHLINLLRHQRVEWAAMEFLLKSYKKHSQWVWLMQLLLLLMRMAAAALIVAMLAQLITPHLTFLQGKPTHHYVLLDDSFSMADRAGGDTAFDGAKKAIVQIANRASGQDNEQRFTLIRFSRAAGSVGAEASTRPAAPADDKEKKEEKGKKADEKEAAGEPPAATGDMADFNAAVVDVEFDKAVEAARNRWEPSQLAVGPLAALRMAQQLASAAGDENRVLYVVSDFRAKDWESPAELRETLQAFDRLETEIHLVSCVDQPHNNLTLTFLDPEEGTKAAGVPLFVEFAVKNHGTGPARDVKVSLASTYYPPPLKGADPATIKVAPEELPAVFLKNINPGETARGRAQVYFPEAGQHVVQATLAEDALAPDNVRYAVVDLTPGNPVLVIDGDDEKENEYYLASVFATTTGEKVKTGIVPESKTVAELRDATAETLRRYYGIYLLNTARLDTKAIENLETYVRGGGCVAIFLGPQTSVEFTNNSLYRKGDGFFPLPLGPHVALEPPQGAGGPDVADFQVIEHPIFSRSFGGRTSNLARIRIGEYFRAAPSWKPDSNTTKVLATLHNHDPLVVEKVLGDGRVVAFLSPLAPTKIPGPPEREWNNWARDPTFVVTLLQLHGYFAGTRTADPPRLVGSGIEIQIPADKYQTQVKFMMPSPLRAGSRISIERQAAKPSDDSTVMDVGLTGVGAPGAAAPETAVAGIYEAWLLKNDSTPDPRRFALNVQPDEGDLSLVGAEQIKSKLGGMEFVWNTAQDFDSSTASPLGSNWAEILLLVLILLLLAEQFVAYLASYHVTIAPPVK